MNELFFFSKSRDEHAALIKKLKEKGVQDLFVISGEYLDSTLEDLILRNKFKVNILKDFTINNFKEGSTIVILEENTLKLSQILISFINAENLLICAPITNHFMSRRPAFTNGIMKSGTHLLQNVMETFGLKPPFNDEIPNSEENLKPGYYYNLQHMNRNFLAPRVQEFPTFISSFCSSVVLFIVRDPRDIVVSMANYLAKQKDYHILQMMFNEKSNEERISAIINGEYPIPIYVNRVESFRGNIRDLFMKYVDWINMPFSNTVLLRFEDLVGPDGGGNKFNQIRSIWAAQLALHVPGIPQEFASNISKESNTYYKGNINRYRNEFTDLNNRDFNSLNQDFMDIFGYSNKAGELISYPYLPNFKGEISGEKTLIPHLEQSNYFSFNIIRYGDRYFAVRQSLGPIDLREIISDESKMKKLISSKEIMSNMDLQILKGEISRLKR